MKNLIFLFIFSELYGFVRIRPVPKISTFAVLPQTCTSNATFVRFITKPGSQSMNNLLEQVISNGT